MEKLTCILHSTPWAVQLEYLARCLTSQFLTQARSETDAEGGLGA
jgi:hypothetical protein